MRTLHLILKRKWYDMIASGEKKEEYREITPYYIERLNSWLLINKGSRPLYHYDNICFHRGYTKTTMTFSINGILIGPGKPGWGAEPGKKYFIIKLGEQI